MIQVVRHSGSDVFIEHWISNDVLFGCGYAAAAMLSYVSADVCSGILFVAVILTMISAQ